MWLLWLSVSLTFLAVAVLLLGVVGYWNATTLRLARTSVARLGTRVTSLLRRVRLPQRGTRVTCHCLACHAFDGIEISTTSKHKLLPRLAGKVAEGLAHEIEDFLAVVESA